VLLKTPITFLFPGAIVVAAAAAALVVAPQAHLLSEAATGYPYAALGAALLLAIRLHRSRLLVATLAVAAAYLALQPWALGNNLLAHALIAAFLPIGFALLAFATDAGLTGARLRRDAALVFGPLAIAAFFSAGDPAGAAELLTARYAGVPLPWLAAVAAMTAIVVSIVRAPRATETGLAWLTFTLALALAAPTASVPRGVWILAAGLVLIVALVETAYALAYHDELTGLPGRRALSQALASLEPPFALAVVDVDHFKSFNDRHGHDVGDQVLCMVASKLRAVGGGGRAFRSGGEEFTMVFPAMSKRDALPYVEDAREAVANAEFTLRGHPRPKGKQAAAARGRGKAASGRLQVTVSVGIASSTPKNSGTDEVLKAADKAMYRAKNEGRNRVAT
jgi:diguanylate cyclase (GGDEF)-like protein